MLTLCLTILSAGETDPAGVIIGAMIFLLLSIIALVLYFLRRLIAIFRHHHQCGTIGIVNLFLGGRSSVGWFRWPGP